MSRKNRLFAKLADTINENGRVETDALSADVSLGVSVDEYADTNAMPTSATLGDLALVTSTNSIYLYNGSAWFNIAMTNQAPTAIAGNVASYELAQDGTPTVITLASTDPEGIPLDWSATTSGDTGVANVTNTGSIFTITPSTDEANAGTLSVTFSVTDGNNTENSTSTFTLMFSWVVDPTNLSYDNISISVTGLGAGNHIRFNDDGTIMYTSGTSQGNISAISMNTMNPPWDISSATWIGNWNTSSITNGTSCFDISEDGTKYYGIDNTYVYQFTLAAPFEFFSAGSYGSEGNPTNDNVTLDHSIQSGLNYPRELVIANGGTRLYIGGYRTAIAQYNLSVPNDISSATYHGTLDFRTLGVSDSGYPYGLAFNTDGTQVYFSTRYNLERITLSTPWDILTAGNWVHGAELGYDARSLVFKPDGTKVWFGTAIDTFEQFSTGL